MTACWTAVQQAPYASHSLTVFIHVPTAHATTAHFRRNCPLAPAQGTEASGSLFNFGDERKPGAGVAQGAGTGFVNGNANGYGGGFGSGSAASAAAGLNALVAAEEERGALLERVFAPSDAGSDGTHRCCKPRFCM